MVPSPLRSAAFTARFRIVLFPKFGQIYFTASLISPKERIPFPFRSMDLKIAFRSSLLGAFKDSVSGAGSGSNAAALLFGLRSGLDAGLGPRGLRAGLRCGLSRGLALVGDGLIGGSVTVMAVGPPRNL